MAFEPNPKKEVEDSNLLNIKQALAKSASNSKNNVIGPKMFDTMFDTVSKNMMQTNSLLQLNNKILTNFTKQLNKTILGIAPKKDIFKKKDPNADTISELNDIENAIKNGQKHEKKKGDGLLGLLGIIGKTFIVGGLLGFLLTGKQEFLFSTVKGFTKYSPKMFGGILNIVEHIGNFGKSISSIFGKFGGGIGEKVAGKAAGKVGKTFLKKIPVIGAALGIFFGIQRFRKGDIVGGILEISSGLSSFIPGAGFGIGLALDAVLLLRDSVGAKKFDTVVGKTAKKIGIGILKNLPGIGTILGIIDGIKKFKNNDIGGGIKDIARGISTISPGGGFIFDMVYTLADTFLKSKSGIKIKEAAKFTLNKLSLENLKNIPVIGSIISLIESFKNPKDAIKNTLTAIGQSVPAAAPILNMIAGTVDYMSNLGSFAGNSLSNLMGMGKPKGTSGEKAKGDGPPLSDVRNIRPKLNVSDNIFSNLKDVKKYIGSSKVVKIAKYAAAATGNAIASGIRFLNNSVDKSGVQPAVWQNFLGMAAEYKALTGHDIQVNDAYRSREEQEKLHALDPKRAPKWSPNSVHYKGLAIDMNTANAEELLATQSSKYPGKNLMDAWGFWRPGLSWPFPESWHVETEATKPYRLSGNKLAIGDTSPRGNEAIGDGAPLYRHSIPTSSVMSNLNSETMPTKRSINSNQKMDLSDATIAALAKSITEGYKSAIPTMSKGNTTIQTNARG